MRSEVFPGDGELFFFLSSYNQQMSTTEAQIRDTCEVGCCGKAQLLHLDIDSRFGVWIQSPVKMTNVKNVAQG